MTLYDKLCSYDNLLLAYKKARRNKTAKWYVRKFEANVERNLIELERDLRLKTYSPKPMKKFAIHEPRTRIISASHFRDRVVHHAICNIIEPIFEKSFIHDSYASRKHKGTHAAIERFDVFKRKISKNGRRLKRAKDENDVIGYVLKADIRHYFDEVDHAVLLSILERKIKDENILRLIEKIISNHETKEPGKGMPIGNLTSQFFANVYLHELDWFVKHKLRVKFYIRYLDDFVILHNYKAVLEAWKTSANNFLKSNLKLELHPDKSKIYPLKNGISFLGFRIFYRHRLLKKRNINAIRRRLAELKNLYMNGDIEKDEIAQRIDGWIAYAMHGNAYKFCNKVRRDIKNFK